MRRIAVIALMCGLVLGPSVSYASDWDKAGKALTVIEGLRLVTGGKVDVIGTIAGLNRHEGPTYRKVEHVVYEGHPRHRGRGHEKYAHYKHRRHPHKKYRKYHRQERVWVPHYVWKREYVPEYRERRPGHGVVVVEAHYITYKVEEGGHWETKYHW